jgi:hypothetical protein
VSAMVVYYDTKDDVATIALRGSIGPGEANFVDAGPSIRLGFNAGGELIAIELHDMDMLHPDLAKDAIQMRPIREGDL